MTGGLPHVIADKRTLVGENHRVPFAGENDHCEKMFECGGERPDLSNTKIKHTVHRPVRSHSSQDRCPILPKLLNEEVTVRVDRKAVRMPGYRNRRLSGDAVPQKDGRRTHFEEKRQFVDDSPRRRLRH